MTAQRIEAGSVAASEAFVPETRIGMWFLDSETWETYVLRPAAEDLAAMVPAAMRSGSVVLDVGCGSGRSFGVLADLFAPGEIHAVEIESDLVLRAQGRAEECACPVVLRAGDAGKLPYADGSIDIIFCHQLLHHTSDQTSALSEFRRVLRPGGMLLVSESCRSFIRTLLVQLFFRHPRAAQRTAAGYVELLRRAGFRVADERVRTSNPFWSIPVRALLRHTLGISPRVKEPRLVSIVASRTSEIGFG